MDVWNNFVETDREYSLAPIDDLIRVWRSKVKVTVGRQSDESIHVNAGMSKTIF